MTTLAIDGDILAWRISCGCEEDMNKACDSLIDAKIKEIVRNTGVKNIRIYLTGKGNFRYDVAVTRPYKGNRAGKPKPQHLKYCENYMRLNYTAVKVDGYEADDAIASDMVQNGAIHCGQDKDLHQIAGTHYDFITGETMEIDAEQATLNLYRQVITGDSTDNIPGLPRVGAKTAAKIVADASTARDDAFNYYKKCLGENMPDIDVKKYWSEQLFLVQMVSDLDVLDMITATVKTGMLRI